MVWFSDLKEDSDSTEFDYTQSLNCSIEMEHENNLYDFDDMLLSERMKNIDGKWEPKSMPPSVESFSNECGPNVPGQVSSPLDLFFCLFR